jgi:hypothetical protein
MLDFLLASLTPESAGTLISKAAQTDLASYLVVVGIVWKVMGSKVAAHFKNLEASVQGANIAAVEVATQLKGVSQELKNLKTAVQQDLKVQSARLENVEKALVQHGERIQNLEGKPR